MTVARSDHAVGKVLLCDLCFSFKRSESSYTYDTARSWLCLKNMTFHNNCVFNLTCASSLLFGIIETRLLSSL